TIMRSLTTLICGLAAALMLLALPHAALGAEKSEEVEREEVSQDGRDLNLQGNQIGEGEHSRVELFSPTNILSHFHLYINVYVGTSVGSQAKDPVEGVGRAKKTPAQKAGAARQARGNGRKMRSPVAEDGVQKVRARKSRGGKQSSVSHEPAVKDAT